LAAAHILYEIEILLFTNLATRATYHKVLSKHKTFANVSVTRREMHFLRLNIDDNSVTFIVDQVDVLYCFVFLTKTSLPYDKSSRFCLLVSFSPVGRSSNTTFGRQSSVKTEVPHFRVHSTETRTVTISQYLPGPEFLWKYNRLINGIFLLFQME